MKGGLGACKRVGALYKNGFNNNIDKKKLFYMHKEWLHIIYNSKYVYINGCLYDKFALFVNIFSLELVVKI